MNYLANIESLVRDERQLKALIWLNKEEFNFLVDLFWETDKEIKKEEYENRLKEKGKARIYSVWAKAKLDSYEKKVFFLIYYLKTYPTFDVLSFWFWMWRSTACENIHFLLPILKRLLNDLWISPKRTIEKVEDLKEVFWQENISKLILDATERRYFRHKDREKQEENYSWKKSFILKKIV